MSRIGNKPIPVPKGAKVELKDGVFTAEGPKGKVSQTVQGPIEVAIEGGEVTVSRTGESGAERSLHGLVRSLLANAVLGVTEGFSKQLEIVGVGYRAEVKGREVHFALGYSHPVIFPIPDGIEIEIDKQNRITVAGCDKQLVGEVAAKIRDFRRPDPYKAKGIRYAGEVIRRKVGKAGGAK